MYRKLLTVVLGMMLVLGMAGCSSNKDTADTENKLIQMSVHDEEDTSDAEEDALDSEDGDTAEAQEDDPEDEDADGADQEEENTSQAEDDPDIMGMDATAYVLSPVNYRDAPNTGSNVLGALQTGEGVHCTGRYANGWTRIEYNGQTCYVYGSYLSTGTGKDGSSSSTDSGSSDDDVETVDAVPTQQ